MIDLQAARIPLQGQQVPPQPTPGETPVPPPLQPDEVPNPVGDPSEPPPPVDDPDVVNPMPGAPSPMIAKGNYKRAGAGGAPARVRN